MRTFTVVVPVSYGHNAIDIKGDKAVINEHRLEIHKGEADVVAVFSAWMYYNVKEE